MQHAISLEFTTEADIESQDWAFRTLVHITCSYRLEECQTLNSSLDAFPMVLPHPMYCLVTSANFDSCFTSALISKPRKKNRASMSRKSPIHDTAYDQLSKKYSACALFQRHWRYHIPKTCTNCLGWAYPSHKYYHF